MKSLKVAVVHDWLLGMRGGEKVLEAICELFPQADLYTLLYDRGRVSERIARMPVRASWLQRLPFVRAYYRYLLPLMPLAIQSFDLSAYDLVVSSSHCVAKGVTILPRAGRRPPLHLCYCHTPMRYLHYQFDNYFHQGSLSWLRPGASLIRPWLARWDTSSSRRVDQFVANSENVRGRISRTYARDSAVIHPPVDTVFFDLPRERPSRGGYYLVVGALVPYKRVDLAIAACRRLGAPLKIIGVGSDERRLRELVGDADVEFLGWQETESLRRHYQECAALLYPQEEDFGISAVEAMACGAPVVAFNKGGALETIEEGVTGSFFSEQTAESLAEAIARAGKMTFDRQAIRARALRFDGALFRARFMSFVEAAWLRHAGRPLRPTPGVPTIA